MTFNDVAKLPETLAALELRIAALEKENAGHKRQLEERQEQIRLEIKSFFKGMTFSELDALFKGEG
ncbi:hypothetical protein HSX37_16150|uniref:Transposase C of IS166 homeodomain-containing protein n=1 Tax=Dendrosporobacter quercicolus TaxID=146817 RepID=A0A1G9ZR03_9FIRM|nr:hypothetical protein [Dendrosporobacter quercicolus]NSL49568.1 hypothetical protein [Dendrosporobacter quercicolus DSM 1736]SDN23043.1 hypothetical protein SAMN04488502_11523 [Dendrosporobacter quercicolus]